MEMCAHRGLSGQAPENSLSAFILAAEAGLPWVELDVQLSADGVPMVIHDESVDRCSDGHGRVRDLSLAHRITSYNVCYTKLLRPTRPYAPCATSIVRSLTPITLPYSFEAWCSSIMTLNTQPCDQPAADQQRTRDRDE